MKAQYDGWLKKPSSHFIPLLDEENLNRWTVAIVGLEGPFLGGEYFATYVAGPNFPAKSPENLQFLTPTGVYQIKSKICISIGEYHTGENRTDNWRPSMGMAGFAEGVCSSLICYKDLKHGISINIEPEEAMKAHARASRSYNWQNNRALAELLEEFAARNPGSAPVRLMIANRQKVHGFDVKVDVSKAGEAREMFSKKPLVIVDPTVGDEEPEDGKEIAAPPAEVAKPSAEAAKPPAEVAKPPAEVAPAVAAKRPAEAAKPVEAAKPPTEPAKPVEAVKAPAVVVTPPTRAAKATKPVVAPSPVSTSAASAPPVPSVVPSVVKPPTPVEIKTVPVVPSPAKLSAHEPVKIPTLDRRSKAAAAKPATEQSAAAIKPVEIPVITRRRKPSVRESQAAAPSAANLVAPPEEEKAGAPKNSPAPQEAKAAPVEEKAAPEEVTVLADSDDEAKDPTGREDNVGELVDELLDWITVKTSDARSPDQPMPSRALTAALADDHFVAPAAVAASAAASAPQKVVKPEITNLDSADNIDALIAEILD